MNTEIYRDKVRACWLGKCLGGNLGMPYEGRTGPLELTRDDVQRISVPNDDLELQMLWLWLIEKYGEKLRSGDFALAWDKWYQADCDEYGVARWNIRRGLKPPLTGLHNNWFTDGMGAAIRSEIWAGLFPGKPDLAAAFAREDACVDHAGEGIFAEIFLAAAESFAFVSGDLTASIDAGLARVPGNSRVAQLVRFVGELWRRKIPVVQAREEILNNFGSENFTDVCMNLGFIMLGLWYGEGEFEKSVLTAVNCGMDTDCTAATTAAMLGILQGTKSIPESWRNSVDNNLVYSAFLKELPLPQTIDEAVERTVAMSEKLSGLAPLDGYMETGPDFAFGLRRASRPRPAFSPQLHMCLSACGQAGSNKDQRPYIAPDKPLDGMTPAMTEDPINDGHQWLIFCSPLGEDFLSEPAAIKQAQNDPARFRENLIEFPGIHMDLSPYIENAGDALHLLTWLKVMPQSRGWIFGDGTTSSRSERPVVRPAPPKTEVLRLKSDREMRAQLMVCADLTGITVWLDERMIMNYHGRRKSVPAFHRVEGGAVVPIELLEGRAHCLRIRLLSCSKPLTMTVALADEQNRYLDKLCFYIKPKT